MMLVGGGCSRALSRAIREYNRSQNSAGAKAAGSREKRCSER